MHKSETILVEEEMEGERLDSFIAEKIEYLSRSTVKLLISGQRVLVNGQPKKASYRIKEGEIVRVEIPEIKEIELIPRDIPLDIIYEDTDVAVVNKPKGLVTHPGHGNWDYTLVNALLYHIKDLSGINGKIRPGIVHRLDKDTSGVMVIAKNDIAHRVLAGQIKSHSFNREYLALVHGLIQESSGTIDAPIERSKTDRKKMTVGKNGKPARSDYTVLERFRGYTLVKVRLFTGRTHQIRVHFAFIKHPVAGDPVYGPGKKALGLDSQALHACLLGFLHPTTGEYMEFKSPLPEYLENILTGLRNTC
ncbi:MAG: RluA family pseudouridine synthase [Syntrophomonadaceae bacterium]